MKSLRSCYNFANVLCVLYEKSASTYYQMYFFIPDWVYANPALVMDFDMVTSRGVPSSDVAASPTSPTAPKSFHRTMSNSSGTSEGRRLGRPTSMPPLPAIDYKLPRASVTKTADQAKIQKSSRKAIRTPSGKSMSATEYLRGGYRPTEKSLSEEGMDFLNFIFSFQ